MKKSALFSSLILLAYACGSNDGDTSSAITEDTDKIYCGPGDGSLCWEYIGTECPSGESGGDSGGGGGGQGGGGQGGGGQGGGKNAGFEKLNISACPTDDLIGICTNTLGSLYFYDEMKANQRKSSCTGDNGAWTDV